MSDLRKMSDFEEKKYTKLRSLLSEMNPADIAVVLEAVEPKDLPVVFRILPKETAAETFVELESDISLSYLYLVAVSVLGAR